MRLTRRLRRLKGPFGQPLGAEALGTTDRIDSIAPGLDADIIALDSDPLTDITAVRRLVFVMKRRIAHKNTVPQR